LDPLVLMGLTFLLLLGLGVPVAFVLGISSLIYFLLSDQIIFINVIAERFFSGMNLFVLMAIPLFIFMGEILNKSNITKELVDFADILVGRFRGGLAHVNIVVSTLFAGITGSALSDISALGSLLIPAMEEQGYDTEFSAAVTVGSSLQGPIIPPSIPAVLVAGVSGISVGGVFLGGAIPGLMFGLSCIVITIIRSKQRNYPKHVIKMTFNIIWAAFKTSFLALITPVIVIGGMLGGVFTPTEAAAIASTYALFLTFVVRKTSLKELKQITYNVVISTSKVYFIIGICSVFSWILTIEQVPQLVMDPLMSLSNNKYIILLILNLILLFWGMWLDIGPAILILSPIFFPIIRSLGMSPVHFGVIMVVNLMIGLATPPFGLGLFAVMAVSKVEYKKLIKELMPFYLGFLIVLLLINIFPELVLFIPRFFGIRV
jgi:tripartite ATP-independent transporter DctM subunit